MINHYEEQSDSNPHNNKVAWYLPDAMGGHTFVLLEREVPFDPENPTLPRG